MRPEVQDLASWLDRQGSYRPETWTGLFMHLDEIRTLLELESENLQSLVLLNAIESLAQTVTRDT